MDTRLFLGGAEKTTLKDLSESLGKETIYLLNNSVSKGNSPSYSQNEQKLGKELMSVDDIVLCCGLLHRSLKKQRNDGIFKTLGTAVNRGNLRTNQKQAPQQEHFAPT